MSALNQKNLQPLGILAKDEKIFFFFRENQPACAGRQKKGQFEINVSQDGFAFRDYHDQAYLRDNNRKTVDLSQCRDFRIFKVNKRYFLTYKIRRRNKVSLYLAFSSDLVRWKTTTKVSDRSQTAIIVPDYQYKGKHVMYLADNCLRIGFSSDLQKWQIAKLSLLTPKVGLRMKIANLYLTKKGICLIYYLYKNNDWSYSYQIRAVFFNKNNPYQLLTHSEKILFKCTKKMPSSTSGVDIVSAGGIKPLGLVKFQARLFSYWQTKSGEIFALIHPFPDVPTTLVKQSIGFPFLNRFIENPILRPVLNHFWESKAVFNPAAVYEAGRVHLLYRAIGDKDVSVLGYASSVDGVHFDQKGKSPAFVPTEPFENGKGKFCSLSYFSGGGGGCEDPRLTKIGDRFYMTYVAYDGCRPPRIALTSIKVDDFLNQRWSWKKPVLISRPDVVDKNACILPEKAKGKYVIFHRIFPNILIDFVDSLDFDGKTWLQGEYIIKPRKHFWDSRKIGIGPTPIKTSDGWLALYHGVGEQDSSRYKMGAMLLDISDPTRVLLRSRSPILEPSEYYENEGFKYGVVYPCGATLIKNNLFVYYGGADTVICGAFSPLNEFMDELKNVDTPRLKAITIN